MKLFRRRQSRKRDLDERIAHAWREAEESRRRLEAARAHVVAPLRERGGRNQFAELIRMSLHGGHR